MAEHTFLRGPKDWWRQAVVYQIYPRSYADQNGDGIGDLKGITSRVPYLKELGVDAVWLSPFYPSELADGGYDVADYRNIDPRIGTLEEFDVMLETLHANGIRVFVDVVPNHSSDQHEWFQAALKAAPGSPERDRYIFRDGKGENGEIRPSELVSHFGPTAWTRITEPDGTPGQWYMHLFAKEQPDFNWDNQEVRDDFIKTMRFWSDRGVDGYRIDVAHALVKDLKNGHLPERQSYDVSVMKDDGTDDLFDRDEVHEIYASWRQVYNEYDPPRVAVAEAWVHANRRAAYASEKGLGQSFSFDLLGTPWNSKKFHDTIDYNLKASSKTGSSTTWVFSNHDVIRHATRFGLSDEINKNLPKWFRSADRESQINFKQGLERARAATMLILALPGSTYLYQGEELGLHEPLNIPSDQMQDPQWFRSEGSISRDGCRVPMPWTSTGSSFGFGPGGAHLPQPDWFKDVNVEKQDGVKGSTLEMYRDALRIRKDLVCEEKLTWVKHWLNSNVLHFKRPNGWQSITNFGTKPIKLPKGQVQISSQPLVDGKIAPNTTVWLQS
ncbi:glycoside hydrolase family 13 protein [Rhodoluna sp.]|uniref:glycoside hydrolase family 13 protein n=1 Tax=Rhodoluna sp. TaxID=1969481 RepID=UPI0025CE7A21|nr:glycoside hydrolase family 13 protein [Rhodoluna sp.]